uniref:Msx2-interacting protein n=1 Tax=Latimeria chalumnae TaxID=7897 RepID=H3A1Y8_LATCH
SMVRETRHLWVGNLPENVREEKIIEHFKRYGRVESVKILPKRGSEGGVAAFVDFVDIKSAQKAHNSVNKMGDRDLRTDYNEPGTIPSAARGLDDTVSIGSRSREVSGFRGGGGGPAYGPPPSLHGREGRYERRLDGASDNRERTYEHSAYGHHERGTGGFDRTRHYEQDYYRDPRERTLQHGLYYSSRSRSPSRFDAHDPRYEPRAREQFTLSSVVHRDIYRDDIPREVRGRRQERNYQHSRSRSPHSSQSRNQSPQRLANQTTRPPRSPSGSGSRSRSSSSDSVSSSSSTSSDRDSSDSSSSSSDESPARSVQSTAVPAPPAQPPPPLEKDEPRKSFGIKVQNLPVRSTDTSLKDGLFHEFKKYGKVTSVQIHGASEERYGLVFFRQQEDQEKALNASKGKLFFGMQIEVTAWIGPETESENEFRPLDERIDEFHPKATRTLFIGNLEKTTTYHDLRNIFQRFGEIVDIDIKKVNGVPQYAFLQYCDIASVCKAIKKMDGEYLGNNRLKLGFGKSMPTNCVWLDGLSTNVTEQYLTRHFCRYGPVVKVVFDRLKGMALILYNEIEYAQAAVKETKGRKIGGNKIKVDFANRESQLAFYRSMESSGQDIRDFYEMLAERRDERRAPYHEYPADRTYYETVRAPGTYPEDPRREYQARGREFYPEWDPYQGDYYDPRYYDDPREYRDYRDPYEQDIREYSYRQRERERERERFESDRDRDHERRTIERSQSPTHSRRAQSPVASPSQSERLQSDSERRIYSRSSDRSGSCSSLSPPRYEKLDKARADRYNKNDKVDKERTIDPERTDKEKRVVRKEKPEKLEKEKLDKLNFRKLKAPSPSSPSSETDKEAEIDPNSETLKGKNKQQSKEKVDKEGISKNRLELMPCVVLTRVKEKEGKVVDQPAVDKQRGKSENDTVKSPPPEQKLQFSRVEQAKPDLARTKVPKEKTLASHVEVVDKEVKLKPKKHLKPEQSTEGVNTMDIDKLEARKRRFADANLKPDRQKLEVKRTSLEEEEVRLGLKKQVELPSSREVTIIKEGESERKPPRKELLNKREHKRVKPERLVTVTSPRDGQEPANISVGIGLRPGTDLQARLGEPIDEPMESHEIPSKKLNAAKMQRKGSFHQIPQLSEEQGVEREIITEESRRNYTNVPDEFSDHRIGQERSQSADAQERLGIDIDYTQSYRKQMERSRRLKQQQELETAKLEKFGSPRKDVEEYERRSLVHEVGKPPQDVTDDSPPSKRKKTDPFEFDASTKRERNYRSSRQMSEDSERNMSSPGLRHFCYHEDDDNTLDSPRLVPLKETKDSPRVEEKSLSYPSMTVREDLFKFNPYEASRREQMTDITKIKLSNLSSENEINRWDTHMKHEANRFDVSFPSSVVKRESIRKRSVRELEPGEVPSDSDDENDNKTHSPKVSTLLEGSRLSFYLRDREERLPSSLERNKFYSFALDKTITPDTKALLERAKSLSSSREENWSFLDRDSRFASFRNNKDKEKVESAPRPIPSWYMKKKKIRTDSEGKMGDKKEDHKEEEQERQELFASRFLHSSIFEQDSKRLQHLERKDDDLDFTSGRLYGRQVSSDGTNSSSELVQEPVVLFHSRFMELTRMQQKEKEKDQKPKEPEKQEADREIQAKTPEVASDVKEPEVKPITPVGPPPVILPPALPQDPKQVVTEKSASEPQVVEVASTKGEKVSESGPAVEESKPKPEPSALASATPNSRTVEPAVTNEGTKEITPEPMISDDSLSTEHPSYLDTKPPTPGASFSHEDISLDQEPETLKFNVVSSGQVQKSEESSEDKETSSSAITNTVISHKAEEAPEAQSQISDKMEAEPAAVSKDRKPSKNKRTKASAQTSNVVEKPATRKSERIDREKLKRSTSPRGEALKSAEIKSETEKVSRTSAKSPSYAAEPETSEPNLPVARTRRRNVRSVYATTGDNEGPSPVKDSTELPRSTRKRGEKETQETSNPPKISRRGRPPKLRRKTGEDTSPIKSEPLKQEAEETGIKETIENSKPVEGWKSPRSQKLAQTHSPTESQHAKKGGKAEPKTDISAESSEDTAVPPEHELLGAEKSPKVKSDKEEVSEQNLDGKELDTETCPSESTAVEVVEKKTSKSISGRYRTSKAITEIKPLCLKNVEIQLRPVEEDTKPVEQSPPKTKCLQKDNLPPGLIKDEAEPPFPETLEKETAQESEPSSEAALLAKQMELEQAVENIAKLTEVSALTSFKEPSPDEPEIRPEDEVEKPAHQASETELAAAIDSIMKADEISADTDSFPAPPPYAADAVESEITGDSLVMSTHQEAIEPETETNQAVTNILETESEVGCNDSSLNTSSVPAIENEGKDSKVGLSEPSSCAREAETVPLQEPIEGSVKSRGRPKSARLRRPRKRSTGKKGESIDDNHSEPEATHLQELKQPGVANAVETSPKEVLKGDEGKLCTEPVKAAPEKSKVVPNLKTPSETIANKSSNDTEPLAESREPVDLPPHSAPAEDKKSPTLIKVRHSVENIPVTLSSVQKLSIPALPTTTTAKIPLSIPSGVVTSHSSSSGIVPDWMARHDDTCAQSTPPPAPPPDTKASDLDTNSSTLRKILMEPKYVSSSSSNTLVTTSHGEPVSASRLEETVHPIVETIKPVLEEKPAVSAINTHVPSVVEAPVFNEKEKLSNSVVAPKATSVISKMPSSFDLEETPRIILGNRGSSSLPSQPLPVPGMTLPKQKYRPSINNDNRFHMVSMGVIGEDTRPVESGQLNTGSSPGLRVNTSEGVVVLSYSGQKTEGPQRISAKISQIPPASAVDIEFQQSVSKSQIKQEPVTPSQSTPKGPQTPTGYGSATTHSPGVLSGHITSQTYNTQPVISSIKQEHSPLEKSEPIHHTVPTPSSQSGPVKILSPGGSTLMFSQLIHQQNVMAATKKEPVALKAEPTKVPQPANLSPGLSPHHPSLSSKLQPDVNHVSSGPSTPTERALPHPGIKQEPHSPRTCGHSPSPFPKVCQSSSTSSPVQSINASVMLGPGIPVPQYVSPMHPEQSVIMPPHSVTQTVSLGHLSQGEVRMNTPPLPGIPYGMRSEALHSPRPALQPQMEIRPQRSNTPQPTTIRDMVMPPLPSQHPSEEEVHHYHPGIRRGSGSLQPEVLVMQPDYRMHSTGLRLEQYNMPQEMLLPRDVRMMMHPHIGGVGDHHPDSRQVRTPDGSGKTPPTSKTPQPGKETTKPCEVKMSHSPHSETRLLGVPPGSQISALPLSQPVMVSHGVQLMHPAGGSFHDYRGVYSDMRNYHGPTQLAHPQYPGASPIGINLPSRSMTPSQSVPDGDHTHPNQPIRSKTPQISQDSKGPPSSGSDHPHHMPVNRHPGQMDPHLQHLQRVQVEASPSSYPSPVAISIKQELPSPHQQQPPPQKQPSFITMTTSSTGMAVPRSDPQSVVKQEPAPPPVSQRPVDMVQLLTKYPIVWQGLLALKNDTAAVQLHFVSGNNVLAHRSLPAPEGGPPLRIAQRMRLEASQLEGVARRMTVESDYCLLLALPCGRDQGDVVSQTESLKAAFISYLQNKQAAGIINVPNPGSNQPAYVLQIFPPCEFSESHLSRLAPDLLASISNISPHLMIVIASV